MINPLETGQGLRSISVVPEAPKVGLGVAAVAEGTVVGKSTVESVGGLKPAAVVVVETSVLGAQPVDQAREAKPTPAPVK